MADYIELSRFVKLARGPVGEPDLETFAQSGIRSVVDIRDGSSSVDTADGLTALAEAERLQARGIDYLRVAVGAHPLDAVLLDHLREALETARKPLLIHGGDNSRAGLIALVQAAIEAGLPGDHMTEMARSLDLTFASPEERDGLVEYVNERGTRPDPFERRRQDAAQATPPRPLLPPALRELRDEMQEDHRRGIALHHNTRKTEASGVTMTTISQTPAGLSDYQGAVTPRSRTVTVPIGGLLAVLGLAVIALDRRLMIPVLVVAGAYAGRAVTRRNAPMVPLPPPEPRTDREIAELEARIRRLSKVA